MPFEFRKSVHKLSGYKQKSLFPTKPEVDFQQQQFWVIVFVEPYHIPFEFQKSVYLFSGYKQKVIFRPNRK